MKKRSLVICGAPPLSSPPTHALPNGRFCRKIAGKWGEGRKSSEGCQVELYSSYSARNINFTKFRTLQIIVFDGSFKGQFFPRLSIVVRSDFCFSFLINSCAFVSETACKTIYFTINFFFFFEDSKIK